MTLGVECFSSELANGQNVLSNQAWLDMIEKMESLQGLRATFWCLNNVSMSWRRSYEAAYLNIRHRFLDVFQGGGVDP
jgi:hypothetical protein